MFVVRASHQKVSKQYGVHTRGRLPVGRPGSKYSHWDKPVQILHVAPQAMLHTNVGL